MFRIDRTLRNGVTGTLLGLLLTVPAFADDTEIYQSQATAKGAQPNVLFIIDTSGSMNSVGEVYDPTRTYPGSCDTSQIYYTSGGAGQPKCSDGPSSFAVSRNTCKAAADALGVSGVYTQTDSSGNDIGALLAMYRQGRNDNNYLWRTLRSGTDAWVECEADDGHDGKTATDKTNVYIKNGGGTTDPDNAWGNTAANLWGTSLTSRYDLYSGNYLNYSDNPKGAVKTRLEVVRDAAINLTNNLNNVNLGLMRYNDTAQGGYVISAVQDVSTNRTNILNALNQFGSGTGQTPGKNGTPLSETFYEASLYLQGKAADYGAKGSSSPKDPDPAAFTDAGKTYKSPIQYSCQKNYIVYLTDGAPTVDDDANTKIQNMTGKTCTAQVQPFHDNGWTANSGICMDELASWMNDTQHTDLQPATTVPNNQNAQTYMIGFGGDVGSSKDYLNYIAQAGGTDHYYPATGSAALTTALQSIFKDLQEDSATFVTPSIAVNAFNRAQTDSDLFFSLFKVGKTQHWDGNLKKYQLAPKNGTQQILDSNNAIAVDDTTGFFKDGTTSFWSPAPDGNQVDIGGAVSQLKAPNARNIYTSVNGNTLTAATNAVTSANMTDALVGTGASTTACGVSCQAAVAWARGFKLDPNNPDTVLTDTRQFMGDQLHGRPAVVTYGKTSDTVPKSDSVVFVPTNDGFLHAISGITGEELWAFIPPELLPRLGPLRLAARVDHSYGLDGDIRILKLDANRDGAVNGTDRVWLFFGMRSGGNHYYALDVTQRNSPKLMWNIGPNDLPGIGQTWSPPVVTRVNVKNGNTDSEKFVLIFGGGYDPVQDVNTTATPQHYTPDSVGNRVYMVEASSGSLLWWAGGPSSYTGTPDLLFNDTNKGRQMNNSIPGRVTVVDTNGDQFADRMYVGDMGGRIWRFDIFNGQDRANLVTGGVWAQLGAAALATPTPADNRRFYASPDVSLTQIRGADPFYNVAIGSGYRGHPLDSTTVERFYSLRDTQPYAQLTQDAYNKRTPIQDGDPVDITTDPSKSPVTGADVGWRYTFSFKGQKVLADSTTVAGVVLFPTFEPVSLADKGPCFPQTQNRVYALTAFAGKPALDFHEDIVDGKATGMLDNQDISTTLSQVGIVGEVNVALLRKDNQNPPPTICLAGMEVLKKCVNVGGTVRTFWNRSDAQ